MSGVKQQRYGPSAMKDLKLIFRALHSRNYRLFFGGQGVSLVGTWLTRTATSWLVYRLSNSALLLGIVGFAGQIPVFLFAPLVGVFVDRWDRRRTLLITQTLAMIQSLMLAVLTLTDMITISQVITLSVFQGLINSVDMPARQAFIAEMVEAKDDVPNAIALNSTIFNGARLLGPAIAGILIAAVGEGVCFLLDGTSYLAVLASLWVMRIAPRTKEARTTNIVQGLKDGLTYVLSSAPILSVLTLVGIVSLMAMPYMVLMPVFAKDILQGGAHTLGFLTGASGLGALAGAIYLASRKNILGLGRVIALTAGLSGLGLFAFALSRLLWLSLILMSLIGFAIMVQMASSNTVLQTLVDDDKRGRVMALYTMASLGMVPFGSFFAGALASKIGAPDTILLGGLFCIFGAFMFMRKLPVLRKLVRPIYESKGLIPEVASGIDAATQVTVMRND
jgi:MFS family permease